MRSDSKQIRALVFIQGSIGDTVVTVPALQILRQHQKACDTLALLEDSHEKLPTSPGSILKELKLVDEVISYKVKGDKIGKTKEALKLWIKLAFRRLHRVYYFVDSSRTKKQKRRDKLFFRLCNIREFIDADNKSPDVDPTNSNTNTVSREVITRAIIAEKTCTNKPSKCSIGSPYLKLPKSAYEEVERSRRCRELSNGKPLVAIAPGAKKQSARWDITQYFEVGKYLLERDEYNIVVIGGEAEIMLGAALIEGWGKGTSLCGALSPIGTAAVLEKCIALVGADTGTTHLADAVGTKCVAVYSAQDKPVRWEPIHRNSIVLRRSPTCAGCRLTICKLPSHFCMMDIQASEVIGALKQMLQNDRAKKE